MSRSVHKCREVSIHGHFLFIVVVGEPAIAQLLLLSWIVRRLPTSASNAAADILMDRYCYL